MPYAHSQVLKVRQSGLKLKSKRCYQSCHKNGLFHQKTPYHFRLEKNKVKKKVTKNLRSAFSAF